MVAPVVVKPEMVSKKQSMNGPNRPENQKGRAFWTSTTSTRAAAWLRGAEGMNFKLVLRITGFTLLIEAAAMLLPMGVMRKFELIPKKGSRAAVRISTPIPPSQWVKDRQNSSPMGSPSMAVRMVAPVVVKPEMVSKKQFSINFSVYFLALTGKVRQALKSDELRFFLIMVAVSIAAIAWNIRDPA